tara:strand:- start:1072 stop:1713 length:642 start_codon:yes stop_codon:yes gene_type:complete
MHHEKITDYIKKSKIEPSVILDIGANNGGHSIYFAKQFKSSLVYSFEPDNRAFEKFNSKLKKLHPDISSRIKTHKTCVGNSDGEVNFFSSDGSGKWSNWDSSGSIKKPTLHTKVRPEITFLETTHKIIKLNSWSKQSGIQEIDFIWADMQGAELDMILGASDILNTVKFINVECHNPPLYEDDASIDDIKSELKDFEVVLHAGHDWFFARKGF